jgi:hypothetical protein
MAAASSGPIRKRVLVVGAGAAGEVLIFTYRFILTI